MAKQGKAGRCKPEHARSHRRTSSPAKQDVVGLTSPQPSVRPVIVAR
jgi:hypothetical protein